MVNNPAVIFLMGPTASGKTDVAVRLVEDLPCEIISVDSAMVYRGMDIGTAKPDAEIQSKAPHRLIDICDPAEAYSAAQFVEDARREIEGIIARGNIPLLVGGTFLYVRALYEGLSPLPSADPDIRAQLEIEASQVGWAAMHQKLAGVDPASAQRIHPNDPQRIQRALEIYELTGEPMSRLIARDDTKQKARDKEQETAGQNIAKFPYSSIKIVLAPSDRAWLREKIALRFNSMLQQGLIEEVEALYNRGDLSAQLPSMRAVGYRQVWQYLDGDLDREQMTERGVVATRQYAKRQYTWLRSDKEGQWFDALAPKIYSKILKKLLKTPSLGITI